MTRSVGLQINLNPNPSNTQQVFKSILPIRSFFLKSKCLVFYVEETGRYQTDLHDDSGRFDQDGVASAHQESNAIDGLFRQFVGIIRQFESLGPSARSA